MLKKLGIPSDPTCKLRFLFSFSFFARLSGCKFKKPHCNSADSHEAKHRLEHTEKSLLGEQRLLKIGKKQQQTSYRGSHTYAVFTIKVSTSCISVESHKSQHTVFTGVRWPKKELLPIQRSRPLRDSQEPKTKKEFNSHKGFLRKSPSCTFYCINPGFGRP